MDDKSETLLWQRLINLETAVEKLNKFVEEFKQAHTGLERVGAVEEKVEMLFNSVESSSKGMHMEYVALTDRVRILEEARQRQIQLNTEMLKPKNEPSRPKTIWDLFR